MTTTRSALAGVFMLATLATGVGRAEQPAPQPPPSGTLDEVLELLADHPLPPEAVRQTAPATSPAANRRPLAASRTAAARAECREDAPVEVLLASWRARAVAARDEIVRRLEAPDNAVVTLEGCTLSPTVRQRLLAACRDAPEALGSLIRLLPRTPEAYEVMKEVYDAEVVGGRADGAWKETVRDFLMRRSRHFRDELVARARAVHDHDCWVEHREALEALARLDPAAAGPILARLRAGDQPRSRAVALSLLLTRTGQPVEEAAAARGELQRIVADRAAPGVARDLAVTTLASTAWPGRDVYLEGLFADPSLAQVEDGFQVFTPLAVVLDLDPSAWIPRLARLVASRDRVLHDNAVTCLGQLHLERARPDALRPLLPWLADPGWSSADEMLRLRLLQSLDRVDLPESVPGLVRALDHETGFGLDAAIDALRHYRALCGQREALRRALEREESESHRRPVAAALIECGVLSARERADALEAWARGVSAENAAGSEHRAREAARVALGGVISTTPQGEEVATLLVARARSLEVDDPRTASLLRAVPLDWGSRAAAEATIRDLVRGSVDPLLLSQLLLNRRALSPALKTPLRSLRRGAGSPLGVAAALLADASTEARVLTTGDVPAQRALLACATHARIPLDLAVVSRLLAGELKAPAVRYLAALDTPAARRALLAVDDGVTRIVGVLPGTDPGHTTFSAFGGWEERLLDDLGPPAPHDDIIALLCASYWGCDRQIVVLRRGDEAELRVWDGTTRYRSRSLTAAELTDLAAFIESNGVDDLPALETGTMDGIQYEYVHLRPRGGVRVFMNNPGDGGSGGGVHDLLTRRLLKLATGKGLVSHYPELERLAGFGVTWQSDGRPVVGAGSDATGLLVELTTDDRGSTEWRRLEGGQPGTVVPPPVARGIQEPKLPVGFEPDRDLRPEPAHGCGALTLVAGELAGKEGVWLLRDGGAPALLPGGKLESPVITHDCRFVVGTRDDQLLIFEAHGGDPARVALPAGFESASVAGRLPGRRDLAVVARRSGEEQRVLKLAMSDAPPETWKPDTQLLLLDPERRTLAPLAAEPAVVRALAEGGSQPSAQAGSVWLAVPHEPTGGTRIGRCNMATLSFEPRLTLPGLRLSSRQVWADEEARLLWVASGDLLQMSLP